MSMNKLGDQRYLKGDLKGAKQHYTEALRARQGSGCPSKSASVESQLGVVTSLLKVLDIEQVSICLTHADELRFEFASPTSRGGGLAGHAHLYRGELMSAKGFAGRSESWPLALSRSLLVKCPHAHVSRCSAG